MLCSPPPATTLASSCAGSEGFCAPCCRRSSQRSRIHNRPKTGRTLLLHERLQLIEDEPESFDEKLAQLEASAQRLRFQNLELRLRLQRRKCRSALERKLLLIAGLSLLLLGLVVGLFLGLVVGSVSHVR